MDVLRQGAQGYSSEESLARKEQALSSHNQAQQATERALQSRLARAGVRGGQAGAQVRDTAIAGLQQRGNIERDLFISGEQAKQTGAQNLYNAASNVGQFDLGQAAKEKNIALQSGFGFAQLGSAERAAFLSSQSADKAAAARMAGVGGGGGSGLMGGIGGGIIGGAAGAVTGAVGAIFCHEESTLVLMEDLTYKMIKDIRLGDSVHLGGEVKLKGDLYNEAEMFEYKGELVTGSHYVLEGDNWLKVKDSSLALPQVETDYIICPIETENGVYVTKAGYVSADFAQEYSDLLEDSNYEEYKKVSV